MCSTSPEADALVLASELAMRAVGAQSWRQWCAPCLLRVVGFWGLFFLIPIISFLVLLDNFVHAACQ